MARFQKERNLKARALKRYAILTARRNKIDMELRILHAYLEAVGENGTHERSRSKKSGLASSKPDTVVQSKSEALARKLKSSKPPKLPLTILAVFKKSEKGISISRPMKQNEIGGQLVTEVLDRVKRKGKVRR